MIEGKLIEKPKIGQPCNGCGICCQKQICRNGAYILKLVKSLGETLPGPCPALISNPDGSYSCGVVVSPLKYIKGSKYREDVLRRSFMIVIGSGLGCDELLDNDTYAEELALENLLDKLGKDFDAMSKIRESLRILYNK